MPELITLPGRIPSKKNSRQTIFAKGRMLIIPSKNYKAWHEEMSWELKRKKRGYYEKCEIQITFYFPDNRRADMSNKAESVMDLLVDNGILKDDSWQVVSKLTLISGGKDKVPRAEVLITSLESSPTI